MSINEFTFSDINDKIIIRYIKDSEKGGAL